VSRLRCSVDDHLPALTERLPPFAATRGCGAKRGNATAQAYVPLSFASGEAYQFDWSHEIVLMNRMPVTVEPNITDLITPGRA
jgi:hypothetical protein